jgi:putative hydrolase of the HAD superfamily
MIKAVFFDLFNTLVRYDPAPEDQQWWACREYGIDVDKKDLRHGFYAAGDFFSREDARLPVEKRCEEEKQALWIEYEMTLLREAGVEVSRELAIQILTKIQQVDKKVVLFDDTLPTLDLLRSRGLTVGLISNLHTSLDGFCAKVGLGPHLDFALTSHEVGFAKPHPGIFNVALERANTQASEAIHVGDQYYADIVGARGAGIKPLLIDRDGFLSHHDDCQHISELREVLEHL